MKRTASALTLISALLISTVAVGIRFLNLATANPGASTPPILAMPEEQVDYTITCVNGTFWARIDGTYPIYVLNESDDEVQCAVPSELPMVYPTPLGTTNIHVKLNGTELTWSNYTEAYPYETHHTAIGDWPMIYCVISPISDYFLLTIHYEHPLAVANGSYIFLYDLNISPYLSYWSNSSTAYFTVRLETTSSNIRVFTTETDSDWNTKSFTLSTEGSAKIVSIQMRSELSKPLAGDLVVMFDDSSAQMPDETHYWVIVPLLMVAVILALIVYRKKRS
jgi:hypothetical protein